MFFIGIFGIEDKQKEIKFLNNIPCKNCDKGLGGRIIKTFSFFHFFFIPIFKWNEKYYVICSACNAVYEIPENKGKEIEKGKDIDITYWDLKPVDNGFYTVENRCPHCDRIIGHNFQYCPYCGSKIK